MFDLHPIGYEVCAGSIEFIGRQFLAALLCHEVDCQVKVFCTARTDSGDQMYRQGANDDVTVRHPRKIKVG